MRLRCHPRCPVVADRCRSYRRARAGLLAEVFQQFATSAAGDFTPAEQGIELGPFDTLVGIVCRGFFHHARQSHHILQAVDHPGIRREAVAPGTSGFLIIGFHAFRQIDMGDKAHVRFVDAHAEGDGRHHHHSVLAQKSLLMVIAYTEHRGPHGRAVR